METNREALIVDDEEKVRFFLTETMKRSGYTVTSVSSGEEALAVLQNKSFDLAILDLKLKGRVDGQRLLEAIRWRWPTTIVIILTAHGSLESALEAIHEGVDSYLLKPIRPDALRQAVEDAFARRQNLLGKEPDKDTDRIIHKPPFTIDLDRHEVTRDGELLDLSLSDYKLLVYLIENIPQVVAPKALVKAVAHYEPETPIEAQETIKWYIHRLRQKVEPDPSNPIYILNVRGVGYRFAD